MQVKSISGFRILPAVLAMFMIFGSAVAQFPDQSFKAMSFNIRYGTANDGENSWPARKGILLRLIERESPDILGLQEALKFQIDEIRERFLYYRLSGRGRDDGKEKGEFSAILYHRDRFQKIIEETFWLSETPSVPGSTSWGNSITRICSWIELRDRYSGRYILVINLHLDHRSQKSREKSVELVLERFGEEIASRPVIIMGDFNAGEDNPAIRKMLEFGSEKNSGSTSGRLRDSFRVLHPEQKQAGTFNGFKGRRDGPKIDYLFISRHFKVRSADILDYNEAQSYPSDHFPVVAVLELID